MTVDGSPTENAAGKMAARVKITEWTAAFLEGSSTAPGEGTGAWRKQQALGASLLWQAKRIARQQADSTVVLAWQTCAIFSGSATIAKRRNRHMPDFLSMAIRGLDRLIFMPSSVPRMLSRGMLPVNDN
jgi:hypothetical protein